MLLKIFCNWQDTEKLCNHCSGIMKTLLFYRDCFTTNAKHTIIQAAMKKIPRQTQYKDVSLYFRNRKRRSELMQEFSSLLPSVGSSYYLQFQVFFLFISGLF